MLIYTLIYSLLVFSNTYALDVLNSDVVVKNVGRSIDITSQLVKVVYQFTFENKGKNSEKYVLFAVEPQFKDKVAFVGSQIKDFKLKAVETKIQNHEDKSFWRIDLKSPLLPDKTVSFDVELIAVKALVPYPAEITQREKQLVKFSGNAFVYSPYKVLSQTTTIATGTKNIESFSKLQPSKQVDKGVSYGPYENTEPFSEAGITVHYENNSPFLIITRLERTLEISHWGNIAVEEDIDVYHHGAQLKGPFSRYEYQREANSGVASVKSFKTVLPASAISTYYRDEIGNISTSHLRVNSDSVELELRPRFPLFGGWKTHYILGYNVPSYEYLFNSGNNYVLKMRLVDHVFDNMIVEELVTKIILPEGAHNIKFSVPYPVTRLPDSKHYTYLDTKGRPVISVKKNFVVENHIQDFELTYVFPRILMLQEPVLLVVAFYLLFLFVIIYIRLDFSISPEEPKKDRTTYTGLCQKLITHQVKRLATFNLIDKEVNSNKNQNALAAALKPINQEYKFESTIINDLLAKVKGDANEKVSKLAEAQKLDKVLKEHYTQNIERYISGSMGKSQLLEELNSKKKTELVEKINSLLS
ncbi:dolichyl-diphosphooligosaccharide--protein glycosyltransferase subunit 1 [Bemisia tabaci]